jgi:hypothetical protein
VAVYWAGDEPFPGIDGADPWAELLAGFAAAEIPHSGHWPMYSNPVTMRDQTVGFQARNKLGQPTAKTVQRRPAIGGKRSVLPSFPSFRAGARALASGRRV